MFAVATMVIMSVAHMQVHTDPVCLTAYWRQLHPHHPSLHYPPRRTWGSSSVLQRAIQLHADIRKHTVHRSNGHRRQRCRTSHKCPIYHEKLTAYACRCPATQMLPGLGQCVGRSRSICLALGKHRCVQLYSHDRHHTDWPHVRPSIWNRHSLFLRQSSAPGGHLRDRATELDHRLLLAHARDKYHLH